MQEIFDKNKLDEICKKYHIKKLSLFGSTLKGKAKPESDVDVLVEFEEGHTPGFFKFAEIQIILEEISGKKIDLRTPQMLSKYFRDEVVKESSLQYGN